MTLSDELILGIIFFGLALFTISSLGFLYLFSRNPFAGTMYLTAHLLVGLGVRLSLPDFNFDVPVKWSFFGDKEWLLHVSSGDRAFSYFLVVMTVFVFGVSVVGYLMTVLDVPKAPSLRVRLGMLWARVAGIWRKPPVKVTRSRKNPSRRGDGVAAAGAVSEAAAAPDCSGKAEEVLAFVGRVPGRAAGVQAGSTGEPGGVDAVTTPEKPDAA